MSKRHRLHRRVLRHLAVLKLEPGDLLVLQLDERMPAERAHRLQQHVSEVLGRKVVVLDGGMTLAAVRGLEPVR